MTPCALVARWSANQAADAMCNPSPIKLRRFRLWTKTILLAIGLANLAVAASPYLDGWYSPGWGAVSGDYIEGTWVAYDDDNDLATMEVQVYSPSGQLVNFASGVYDPHYSGYSLGVTTWEPGVWLVYGKATDSQGNCVEGWHSINVDNPPPPYP